MRRYKEDELFPQNGIIYFSAFRCLLFETKVCFFVHPSAKTLKYLHWKSWISYNNWISYNLYFLFIKKYKNWIYMCGDVYVASHIYQKYKHPITLMTSIAFHYGCISLWYNFIISPTVYTEKALLTL